MRKVFVDSNVFLYQIEDSDPVRQSRANEVIDDPDLRVVVSLQVLQEVYNNAVRKQRRAPQQARAFVQSIAEFEVVLLDQNNLMNAIDSSDRNQINLWDALIVEAAVVGGCKTLLTEDLTHGQVIRGVRIVNPFI